jgi:hypothetical protein
MGKLTMSLFEIFVALSRSLKYFQYISVFYVDTLTSRSSCRELMFGSSKLKKKHERSVEGMYKVGQVQPVLDLLVTLNLIVYTSAY